MISLFLIFYTLIARLRLPFGAPGRAGLGGGRRRRLLRAAARWACCSTRWRRRTLSFPIGLPAPQPRLPGRDADRAQRSTCPWRCPFAILTVVGGINVTESARLAGDDYRTRYILLTEAVATLLAGVCGGVSQTTPYIGHPAYKAMGGRAAYTLATRRCSSGWAGCSGYIPFLAMILPIACLAPILIFVAFDIVAQSFHETPARARGRGRASRSSRPSPSSCSSPSTRRTRVLTQLRPRARTGWRRRLKIPLSFAENFGVFVHAGPRLHPDRDAVGRGAGLPDRPPDRRHRGHAGRLRPRCRCSASSTPCCPTGGIYLPWSAALLGSRGALPLGGRLRASSR